jgi:hypothetical protein
MRVGNSIVVVLPKDWTRGQEIGPGDTLDVAYNGIVEFSVPDTEGGEEDGSNARGRKSNLRSA